MLRQRNIAKIVIQAPDKSADIEHWLDQAACKDWDTSEGDPFFPVSTAPHAQMEGKKICADCPVRMTCLEWALENPAAREHGIYGGTTGDERRRMHRTRAKVRSKQRAKAREEQDEQRKAG